MKKHLLLAFAFIAMAIGVNAQESKVWNIDGFQEASYTETTVLDGLTLFTGTTTDGGEVKWEIDNPERIFTFGDITCSKRLKSGGVSQFDGDGNLLGRALEFKVSTKGTIRFAAVSSNSGGTKRYVEFVIDGETAHSYNVPSGTGSMALQSFNYEGKAGTMQVFITDNDGSGGINFYYLDWTDLSEGTEPGTGDEEVIEWSFNSADYLVDGKESGITISAGEYAIADGMTIIASADDKVKLEINKSIAEGAPSTIATRGALNTGGNRNGFSISNVKAGDKIQFAMAATGEVKEGAIRGVDVSENDATAFEPFRLEVGDPGSYPRDFEYTVKADGVVKFLSEQAVVFYNVILTKGEGGGEPPVNSIDTDNVEKEIVATEYYNINGIRLAAPVQGINIIKNVMSDGSVETTKKYIQ